MILDVQSFVFPCVGEQSSILNPGILFLQPAAARQLDIFGSSQSC